MKKNEIALGFQEFAPLSATKLEQVDVKVCMPKGTAARDLGSLFLKPIFGQIILTRI
jgi:hypothetical protein